MLSLVSICSEKGKKNFRLGGIDLPKLLQNQNKDNYEYQIQDINNKKTLQPAELEHNVIREKQRACRERREEEEEYEGGGEKARSSISSQSNDPHKVCCCSPVGS